MGEKGGGGSDRSKRERFRRSSFSRERGGLSAKGGAATDHTRVGKRRGAGTTRRGARASARSYRRGRPGKLSFGICFARRGRHRGSDLGHGVDEEPGAFHHRRRRSSVGADDTPRASVRRGEAKMAEKVSVPVGEDHGGGCSGESRRILSSWKPFEGSMSSRTEERAFRACSERTFPRSRRIRPPSRDDFGRPGEWVPGTGKGEVTSLF